MTLLRRLARGGFRECRVLVLCDSRVAMGAIGKGRSSARRLNKELRRIAALVLGYGFVLDVVWIPTWANASDAPSRGRSLASWEAALPEWAPSLSGLNLVELSEHRRWAGFAVAPWDRLLCPGAEGMVMPAGRCLPSKCW